MKRYVVSIILCAGLQISSLAQQPAPVAVVISSPNQVVKVGSEIRVDITVSNVTTQSVSEYWAGEPNDGEAEAGNDIQIFDANGKKLSRMDGPVIHKGGDTYHLRKGWISRRVIPLGPGKTSTNYFILTNLFDLSKPGTYTVVVRHELQGEGDYIMVTAQPNPLTITITQ